MRKVIAVGVLILSLGIFSATGCSPSSGMTKLKVVTSTSLLASIVEQIGNDRIELLNIISPAQCPAHYDVKPGDIQKLADADLFLLHGWQGEKFSEELIASANNPDLIVVKIDVMGNWMAPPVQTEAVDKVAPVLSRMDERNSAAYQASAAKFKERIAAREAEIRAKLAQANLSTINVISNEQQAGFLQWTGLNVISTYGEADSLTPQVVKGLVDKGREAKVTLIIDNLQNGADTGKGIAEELGARRVTLSNFPGGFDNTETWEKTADRNVELILGALAK